jgi:hypothetical protein
MTSKEKPIRWWPMMKVMRLLLNRLMPLLLAGAFLALPASSEPVCDPHAHHACAGLHMELHDGFGSHDPASHEHSVHAHGNCHVPMTELQTFELTALASRGGAVRSFADLNARSAFTPTLERPPRT